MMAHINGSGKALRISCPIASSVTHLNTKPEKGKMRDIEVQPGPETVTSDGLRKVLDKVKRNLQHWYLS